MAKIVETDDRLRYRSGDGRKFKSASSAGSAVMGGKACNGWKFWSITEAASPKAKTSKARPKQAKPEPTAGQIAAPAPEGEAERE